MAQNSGEPVRAFVAVEIPAQTKTGLSKLQDKLKHSCGCCPAKWVAPAGMHLTLNFLGDVPHSKLDDIKKAVSQAAAETAGFELTLNGVGAFPNLASPRIVWVGLGGEVARLSEIQKRLEHLLAGLGFPPENRPFSPHLTLARVRDEAAPCDRIKLGQAISNTSCESGCVIPVGEISLIKSLLTPAGPIYTVLYTAPLAQQS